MNLLVRFLLGVSVEAAAISPSPRTLFFWENYSLILENHILPLFLLRERFAPMSQCRADGRQYQFFLVPKWPVMALNRSSHCYEEYPEGLDKSSAKTPENLEEGELLMNLFLDHNAALHHKELITFLCLTARQTMAQSRKGAIELSKTHGKLALAEKFSAHSHTKMYQKLQTDIFFVKSGSF